MVSRRMDGQEHPDSTSAPRWLLASSQGCAIAFILGALQTGFVLSPARNLGLCAFLVQVDVQLRWLDLSSSSQERDSGLGSFPPDQLSLGGAGVLASATDGAAGCVRAAESMPRRGSGC